MTLNYRGVLGAIMTLQEARETVADTDAHEGLFEALAAAAAIIGCHYKMEGVLQQLHSVGDLGLTEYQTTLKAMKEAGL